MAKCHPRDHDREGSRSIRLRADGLRRRRSDARCADLAEELGIREVVVPIHPGQPLGTRSDSLRTRATICVRTFLDPFDRSIADRDLQRPVARQARAARQRSTRGRGDSRPMPCASSTRSTCATRARLSRSRSSSPRSHASRATAARRLPRHLRTPLRARRPAADIEIVNMRTTAVGLTEQADIVRACRQRRAALDGCRDRAGLPWS